MKKNITFAGVFLVFAFSLASCNGNNKVQQESEKSNCNNAPCYSSTAFNDFSLDWQKVSEYEDNRDYDNAQKKLDEILTKYDFSAPTDKNAGYLLLLSFDYYYLSILDRINSNGDDDVLIEKSMNLARQAYRINREYVEELIEENLKENSEYLLLLKKYVE